MKRGLPLSLLCHSAILGWAILQIHETPHLRPIEPDPVAVDVISDEALTKIMKGDRNAKNTEADAKEAPEPPKKEQPKIAKATPPPPPPPPPPPAAEPVKEEVKPEPAKAEPQKDEIAEKLAMLPPEPAPGPSPDELKKQEEAKKAAEQQKKLEELKKKQAELKKKQEQAKKVAEAKKKLEDKKKLDEKKYLDAMAKAIGNGDEPPPPLLSKAPAAAPQQTTAQATPGKQKGPVKGAAEGHDDRNAGNALIAIITRHIEDRNCWTFAGGAVSADKQIVSVRIRFKPDGNIEGTPEIIGSASEIAGRNAVNAVMTCQPYSELPPDKYAMWKDVILDFDPQRMFR